MYRSETKDQTNFEATIFDIQKFSVHDGPGIRTLIFLKGCLLNCLWCSNPEGQSTDREIMLYPEKCIGCYKCIEVCDYGAIFIEDGQLMYDRKLCKVCGKCTDICPAEARKMVGKRVTVNEVMREIEKDILFYRNSGGGVTFGGGEPLLQSDFVKAVSIECEKKGIDVAIETCGYYPWGNLEKVIEHVNLIMFDLKHMDSDLHSKLCGYPNDLILSNLTRLCELVDSHSLDLQIIVRIPVIPGLNDSKNISNTAKFISSLGNAVTRVELLPYHQLGIKKYERLGIKYDLKEVNVPTDEYMKNIKKLFTKYSDIDTKIGG